MSPVLELSSGSVLSYHAPTRCCPPLPEWPLSEPLSHCGQRPRLSGSPPRRCPGQHFHLSRPPRRQRARPSTRVALPGVTYLHDISLLPPVSLIFFFFNLCGLCNCSLLYTLVLNGYTGRLSRSLTLSFSPSRSFPGRVCLLNLRLLVSSS